MANEPVRDTHSCTGVSAGEDSAAVCNAGADSANSPSLIPYDERYHRHISAEHKLLDFKFGELWQYRDLVRMYVKRTFDTAYKQTVLGPAWLIINPLMVSIMHLIVFGNIAKLGTDGLPQILFYFSSTAIWALFSGSFTRNSTVFLSNSNVFSKVYFPRLAVPVSAAISEIIKFLIQVAFIIVLIVWFSVQNMCEVNWLGLWVVPLVVVQLSVLGMGIGLIVSSLTTKYRDLNVLVGFGVTLWMYATPVAYPLSQLSDGLLRTLVMVNPVTAPVELFRWGLFGSGSALWGAWGISVAVTIAVLLLGVVMFNRAERNFLDVV